MMGSYMREGPWGTIRVEICKEIICSMGSTHFPVFLRRDLWQPVQSMLAVVVSALWLWKQTTKPPLPMHKLPRFSSVNMSIQYIKQCSKKTLTTADYAAAYANVVGKHIKIQSVLKLCGQMAYHPSFIGVPA